MWAISLIDIKNKQQLCQDCPRRRHHFCNQHGDEVRRLVKSRATCEGWGNVFEMNYKPLSDQPITLFVPLSGREWSWPRFSDFLNNQTFDHAQIKLVLCDTSQNPEFSAMVSGWAESSDYDVNYFTLSVAKPGLADEDRHIDGTELAVNQAMCDIYNRLGEILDTELCIIIEDDVIPPLDAITKLRENFTPSVSSISGCYYSRYDDLLVAWSRKKKSTNLANAREALAKGSQKGLEQVGGSGFGCLMIRSELIKSYHFSLNGGRFYDVVFFDEIQDRARLFVDWTVKCDHLDRSDVLRPVLHIITPVTRSENVAGLINNVRDSLSEVDYFIHLVGDGVDVSDFAGERVYCYNYHGSTSIGGLQRNVALSEGWERIGDSDYVYFLDDDNLLHPNLEECFMKHLNRNIIVFGQLHPDGTLRLEATQIECGKIDTGMFVVKGVIAKQARWSARYEADFDYIVQCAAISQAVYFSVDRCTYHNASAHVNSP